MENTSSRPDNLQHVIEEQNNIGWYQLMYSRFTLQWTVEPYQHLVARKIEVRRKNSGTGWIRMLTKIIWNNIDQVWIDRNLVRHGKDEEEQREKERLYSASAKLQYITTIEMTKACWVKQMQQSSIKPYRNTYIKSRH